MCLPSVVLVLRPGSAVSLLLCSGLQVVNICVWVLASAFGVPAMVMGNVEEEQEHNSKWTLAHTSEPTNQSRATVGLSPEEDDPPVQQDPGKNRSEALEEPIINQEIG